ncbi:MAG: type II toxin-antitoxin system HicA family toxin [Gammaproteobacteria bacterium]|nr:type II toxin-antitoxin system HicA family toxin [Gammaproteobacteria bacterium]
MARLPLISAKKFVKFFLARGFDKDRQSGSHIIMTKKGIARPLVIPNYKELDYDHILNNLDIAGITREEYIDAMQGKKRKRPKKSA